MKVVIIGAGSVGRSIARELLDKDRQVTLVDRRPAPEDPGLLTRASWVSGDAAELGVLTEAELSSADVLVAATGDDKVNLVVSMLAKTEFAVPRTVARVSHPSNEWMFGEMWGVDVAVSTPRTITALVEEAVSVGQVVKIFDFAGSRTQLVGITLPRHSPVVGTPVGSVPWPTTAVLTGIIRDGLPLPPDARATLEAHDELMLLADDRQLPVLERLLAPGTGSRGTGDRDELPSVRTED
jgi:trk system potassium uptake protein TrkA